MKAKMITYIVVLLLIIANIYQFVIYNYSTELPEEVVPNEKVAVQIAEVILVSMYDEGVLLDKPFDVIYDKSRKAWIVSGNLPEGYLGFVPEIVIRKYDGKILDVTLE